ncbi:MAG: UPF0280 family protein [Dehalococcoidales bacterium]|nr:UPF0280 family protein [Dehalococcoidales bacterium]
MYEPRTYRRWIIKDKELVSFNVIVKETDLYVRTLTNLQKKTYKLVLKYRSKLEKFIEQHPDFLTSLEPFLVDANSPDIVKAMSVSAAKVGVGPMAAVAGAIAEFVGNDLLEFSDEVIIENGGDIYLKSLRKRVVGIYAGKSPLTGKIGLEISEKDTPLGICTSAGTVGHSLSYGEADAVIVLSKSTALADAAATAVGNLIKQQKDIQIGIEFAKGIEGLSGLVIIKDDNIGMWGEVIICEIG